MPIMSADDFFAVLEKSRLLAPEQLDQARREVGPGDDPRTIAKHLAHRHILTRWQAGQLLAGRSSFFLGKYRLIDLLGRGALGGVFLGEHVTMQRRVALKVLSRDVCHNPAAIGRFLSEARVVAALDHPNIVQTYSIDNEGDRYYLVTEYVEGADLQRLVETHGPVDALRAANYLGQAAEGLEHAHQRHLIHGDVKPSNLMVNRQGAVKILDLGLARLIVGQEPGGEISLGTVDYLAPERTMPGLGFDGRADVYSLGCVLFFLLTGRPPFAHGTLAERIARHRTEKPPDLREQQRPRVPDGLAAICQKMMAKRPDDRHATSAEAGAAITQWLAEARRHGTPPLPRAMRLED